MRSFLSCQFPVFISFQTYRIQNWHEEREDGAHVELEYWLLLTVGGADHDVVIVVDAGDADHEDRGDDEAGVVHGEAQQQGVHGTGHGWSGVRQGHLRRSWTGIEERASKGNGVKERLN